MKEQLLKGMKVGDKTFKVHLDGYNITDALAGKAPSPRHEFFYFNDDGSLVGLRYDHWKIVFAEQRAHGFDVWQEPFVPLRLPEDLQPALRSVRDRPTTIGMGYDQLADRPRLPARAGAAIRRAVPRHVQGIPAEPEGRQLLPRPGAGDALEQRGTSGK